MPNLVLLDQVFAEIGSGRSPSVKAAILSLAPGWLGLTDDEARDVLDESASRTRLGEVRRSARRRARGIGEATRQ